MYHLWANKGIMFLKGQRVIILFCINSYLPIIIALIMCVFFLNVSDESSKPEKRQKQNPGDDISDIQHLLDSQPTSEFTLREHRLFIIILRCV